MRCPACRHRSKPHPMSKSASAKAGARSAVSLLLVAAIAGAAYFAARPIWHRAHVRRALPGVLAEARRQREELVGAIEAYRKVYGIYPPTIAAGDKMPPGVNSLFYELVGTRHDDKLEHFYDPTQKESLGGGDLARTFGIKQFTNTLPFPEWPEDFLSKRQLSKKEFNEGSGIFGVGFNESEIPAEVSEDFAISPWRYAAKPSGNGAGAFDLWLEVDVLGQHYTVGGSAGRQVLESVPAPNFIANFTGNSLPNRPIR